MKEFTGYDYLLIDIASQFGHDKWLYEDRIQWAQDHINELESLAEGKVWKEKPLYLKAVKALRKAQQGKPSGHLVGFDAICSGMQIMSVLTGCESGAKATGLIDPDRRADAYTDCSNAMGKILGFEIQNQRKSVKNATMTTLYGSSEEPKKEFGEDSDELQAFYQALFQIAPGACELLQVLLNSWDSSALAHSWKLPDGFDVKVNVKVQKEARIRVAELGESSFTYQWQESATVPKDCKNAANVVHSFDSYILRSLIRRCSYDPAQFNIALERIQAELIDRQLGANGTHTLGQPTAEELYYQEQFYRSSMVDVVIVPHLSPAGIAMMPTQYLEDLAAIINTMICHKPFHVVTVHDEFKCHPNHMNHLRKHYRNILAEMANSNVLDDILSQLYHKKGRFPKKTPDLATKIMKSQYAIC